MNKKELSITMIDGTKEVEFKTSDFNENFQLAVMNGLFKFFDIDVDFAEMVEVYHKAGKAYQEFYGDKENVEIAEVNEPKIVKEKDSAFIKQYETAIQKEKPVFSNTKVRNGTTLYKCHYICTRCSCRSNRFIDQYQSTINCHDCQQLLTVKTATEKGNLEEDRFGNFFIAGDFKRSWIESSNELVDNE